MIEKLTINQNLRDSEDTLSISNIVNIVPNDIQDSFYYIQDVPVYTKNIFKKTMYMEQLEFIVVRFKSDTKNIAIMNDKAIYKKLLNAMLISNNLRTNAKTQNYNDYETKCYNLNQEFSRIPHWITDESRIYFVDTPVKTIRDIFVGELPTNDQDDDSNIEMPDDPENIEEFEDHYDIGVETVDYALKWLEPKGAILVQKDCLWRNGKCIRLNNPKYIDDPQEFDHIVIVSGCVIMIETKNYKGHIDIDKYGNWSREINGVVKGIRNPKQQIDRHIDLLKSILGNRVMIIGVLCLSHPEVLISGSENTNVDIVRSDLLNDYILAMKDKYCDVYDIDSDKMDILNTINSYKVSDKLIQKVK